MKFCYNCFQELSDTDRVCPRCGFSADFSNAARHPYALPCGSILAGKYLVGRVIDEDGFSFRYSTLDYFTGKLLDIRECFMQGLTKRHFVTDENRSNAPEVLLARTEAFEIFSDVKEQFLSEAKILAELPRDPHIPHILSCFNENSTVYYVTEPVDGTPLPEYMKKNGGSLPVSDAEKILFQLMDALEIMHKAGIICRGIASQSTLIKRNGDVVLTDFHAAGKYPEKNASGWNTIVSAGFSPLEQYSIFGKQGPFTDLYSLAAVFYHAVTGISPPESVSRTSKDKLDFSRLSAAGLPAGKVAVIQKALSLPSDDRYQTISEFRKAYYS